MSGTQVRLLAPALVLVALLPALTGCHVSRGADPERLATAPMPGPDAWPSRDVDAVRGFHERTPEIVRRWELNGLVPEAELGDASRKALASVDRVIVANRLTDHGLLRVWSHPGDEETVFSANRLFGGGFLENAAYLTSRDATGRRLERAMEDLPGALGAPRLEENTRLPGLQLTHVRQSVMLGAGIDLRIPETLDGRGLLIVLGGLFSTAWQEKSIGLFERAGWDVLRIDPASRTRPPNDGELERVRDQRRAYAVDLLRRRSGPDGATMSSAEGRAALEEATAAFPLPASGFELSPGSDPEEVGRAIARAVDDVIAENAYAAQAAAEYLIDTHGREALGPIAVVGYSAGSLAAPAVAARLEIIGVPVDAMILIGSGADLFTISRESTRTSGGIDLTGGGRFTPTQEQIGAARVAYLRHTKLDPYAVGPALGGIPTFLMIASDDDAVPNGVLLDERLGFPDRVRYFGGHRGLFFFLPEQTPGLIRWLGRVAPPP
jgi:hypothetical protein